MQNNDEAIKEYAKKFRSVLEGLDPSTLPEGLRDFPKGACKDASDLLGTLLEAAGQGESVLVRGERGTKGDPSDPWHSHAWLFRDGLIIDVTADQFSEVADKVIVCRSSAFHDTFTEICLRKADYLEIYLPKRVSKLMSADE